MTHATKQLLEELANRALESRKDRRRQLIFHSQGSGQSESLRAIDFNRSFLGIDEPVLFYSIFSVEMSFYLAITMSVLGARREHFDDQVRRAGDSISRSDFLEPLIFNEYYIWNHAAEIAEDDSGPGPYPADRVLTEIGVNRYE